MSLGTALPKPRESRIPALEQEFSEFTYIVSHDLAASFRHITGFSDLLARNIGDVPSSDQGVYVGLIRDAAQKCESMLEQLRAYSRVQSAPMAIVECDAAKLLDVVRLQLSGAIKQCGAQFAIGALEPVLADPELLTEALRHVIDNAIKFRRTGAPPHVAIEQIPDDEKWKLTIADNGIGVPRGDEERMFCMFHRGHIEGAYPGIGAGLAIARRILRRHGGDVRFLEVGAGACVEITLPRTQPAYGNLHQ